MNSAEEITGANFPNEPWRHQAIEISARWGDVVLFEHHVAPESTYFLSLFGPTDSRTNELLLEYRHSQVVIHCGWAESAWQYSESTPPGVSIDSDSKTHERVTEREKTEFTLELGTRVRLLKNGITIDCSWTVLPKRIRSKRLTSTHWLAVALVTSMCIHSACLAGWYTWDHALPDEDQQEADYRERLLYRKVLLQHAYENEAMSRHEHTTTKGVADAEFDPVRRKTSLDLKPNLEQGEVSLNEIFERMFSQQRQWHNENSVRLRTIRQLQQQSQAGSRNGWVMGYSSWKSLLDEARGKDVPIVFTSLRPWYYSNSATVQGALGAEKQNDILTDNLLTYQYNLGEQAMLYGYDAFDRVSLQREFVEVVPPAATNSLVNWDKNGGEISIVNITIHDGFFGGPTVGGRVVDEYTQLVKQNVRRWQWCYDEAIKREYIEHTTSIYTFVVDQAGNVILDNPPAGYWTAQGYYSCILGQIYSTPFLSSPRTFTTVSIQVHINRK